MRSIVVENLGKQYKIGEQQSPYGTLRESMVRTASAIPRLFRRHSNGSGRSIWALKEVGFEVKPGEVVGLIGRNGAGKSTLLKVLSRITEPTEGRVELRGRVASLLEVGTGFHHELTGRENIFLNGSIMGMTRKEIVRRFDEIVAFAGIEEFLDTPIKHYSSGMYGRLGFSLAAHLEAELLLVDEVLAVGDQDFQKKCLGKMEALGRQGRTVIFVSHNMPMILRLCERAVLLDHGHLTADGPARDVANHYLRTGTGSLAERIWPTPETAIGDEYVRLHSVRVLDENGDLAETLDIRNPATIEVSYWNLKQLRQPTVTLRFINEDGLELFASNDSVNREWWKTTRRTGLVRTQCRIPGNFLAEGRIFVGAAVCSYDPYILHTSEDDAVTFQVEDRTDGDGARGVYPGRWPGVVRPMLDWQVSQDENS
ncbi:MAG TPA: ABC transporter ATP-binding protein [Pyrinomonadaceae bacterium]|nr:ABC transporter ATP-binding protein [Pyrinomonadaceae bacterium]